MLMHRVADAATTSFEQVLQWRALRPLFQRIVNIDNDETVGYEALIRGPIGSPWASPDALFAEAYRTGRVAELDGISRAAALRSFAAAGMPGSIALFVNVEPSTFGSSPLQLTAGPRRPRMFLEITERAIAADPAGMLRAVDDARRAGIGVAIDDVGAEPDSLAMMPLIRPDVIKLDLRLIQANPSRVVARTATAVMAEAERTGAVILAEGIETDRQLRVAGALGATLGQGWHFGAPTPFPAPPPAPRHPIDLLDFTDDAGVTTPFAVVQDRRLSVGTPQLLHPVSMHLEYRSLDATEPTVMLACFQDAHRFGDLTRRRYQRLASQGVFTAVVGRGMPVAPGRGIRGADLRPDDPIAREWTVIVLGPHFAAALLARERDHDRIFDFVVSHNRDVVIAAARPLIKRILATGE